MAEDRAFVSLHELIAPPNTIYDTRSGAPRRKPEARMEFPADTRVWAIFAPMVAGEAIVGTTGRRAR